MQGQSHGGLQSIVDYGLQFTDKVKNEFSLNAVWGFLSCSVMKCNELAKDADLKLTMHPLVGEIVSNTDAVLR